jgi:hypothetical protein
MEKTRAKQSTDEKMTLELDLSAKKQNIETYHSRTKQEARIPNERNENKETDSKLFRRAFLKKKVKC